MTEEDSDIVRARGLVGHVLDDKWTLERLLGAGAMGAVYAARHRNGARAAVKLLHPDLARVDQVRERFLREGYAANRVEHPGAVKVLDDDVVKEGPDEGTAYLVMELLEGESLEDRIARGDSPGERELLGILDEVLDVLESAHAHGVVHRDLKPANLLLARDPDRPYRVKVLDFGLARLAEKAGGTFAGLAMGTPSFMSPEQAAGRVDEIDGRTDLFALGATAFLAASGQNVHEAPGVIELVVKMGTIPAPKLRDIAPDVSPELAAIVDRALAFAPADRYPDAAAMRADVRARVEQLEPTAPPTSAPPREAPAERGASVWLLVLALCAAGALGFVFRSEIGAKLSSFGGRIYLVSAPLHDAGRAAPGEPVDVPDASAAAPEDASAEHEALDVGELDAGELDAGELDDDDDDDAGVIDAGAAAKAHKATPPPRKRRPKRPRLPWRRF